MALILLSDGETLRVRFVKNADLVVCDTSDHKPSIDDLSSLTKDGLQTFLHAAGMGISKSATKQNMVDQIYQNWDRICLEVAQKKNLRYVSDNGSAPRDGFRKLWGNYWGYVIDYLETDTPHVCTNFGAYAVDKEFLLAHNCLIVRKEPKDQSEEDSNDDKPDKDEKDSKDEKPDKDEKDSKDDKPDKDEKDSKDVKDNKEDTPTWTADDQKKLDTLRRLNNNPMGIKVDSYILEMLEERKAKFDMMSSFKKEIQLNARDANTVGVLQLKLQTLTGYISFLFYYDIKHTFKDIATSIKNYNDMEVNNALSATEFKFKNGVSYIELWEPVHSCVGGESPTVDIIPSVFWWWQGHQEGNV